MKNMTLRALTVMLVSLVTLTASSCESATPEKAPDETKTKTASAAPSPGPAALWQDIGTRGKVIKVWTASPETWPEIILLRLNKSQLADFEKDPVDFVNRPPMLFKKPVRLVQKFCEKFASAYDKRISDEWLITVPHSDYSGACPSIVPYVPDEATANNIQASADAATAKPKDSKPKK